MSALTEDAVVAELNRRLLAVPSIEFGNGFVSRETMERVVCVDGLSLSVQARHSAYCTPRDDTGPWWAVEVGYPSRKIDRLMPFVEDAERPTDTVYGYVPIEIVAAVIIDAGGIV